MIGDPGRFQVFIKNACDIKPAEKAVRLRRFTWMPGWWAFLSTEISAERLIHEEIVDVYFISNQLQYTFFFKKNVLIKHVLYVGYVLLAACNSKMKHLASKSWWLQCYKKIVAANRYTGEQPHFGGATHTQDSSHRIALRARVTQR